MSEAEGNKGPDGSQGSRGDSGVEILSEEDREMQKLARMVRDHSSEEEDNDEEDEDEDEVANLPPAELELTSASASASASCSNSARSSGGHNTPTVVVDERIVFQMGEKDALAAFMEEMEPELVCLDSEEEDGDDGSLYQPSCSSSSASEINSSADASSAGTSRAPSRLEEGEEEMLLMEAGEIEEEDGDIPVSYYNALVLNETYQNSLKEVIVQTSELLRRNLQRQEEVNEEISSITHGRVSEAMKEVQESSMARKSLAVFNPPYFKDVKGFSHPANQDTIAKRENQELDVYLTQPKEWTPAEKKKLKKAVRDDAIRERMKNLMTTKEELLVRGKSKHATKEEKQAILEQLRELKEQSDEIRSMPDDELFHNREEDFDWMRISAQNFNGTVTAKACELMWKNLLHSSINCSPWTQEEDRMLLKLAEASSSRLWDSIAAELGSGRTGFQCFYRYQSKHSYARDKRKWTAAEDNRLKQLVDRLKINSYVPWSKVSYYMDKRTKEQCYQRYNNSLRDDLRKGAFTEEEDFMIMVGVRIFGTQWVKIANFMYHRSPVQLHSRYNSFLSVNFDHWTPEDDYKLLALVKTHGSKDWVKISHELGTKTRTQCRNRFFIIYKWFMKDPDNFNLRKMRCSTLQKKRQEAVLEKLDTKLSEFLNKQKKNREAESAQGFRTADVQGYHTTPEGVKIPMRDLYAFMTELKKELPGVAQVPEYLQKRQVTLSAQKLGLYEHHPLQVIKVRGGKVETTFKNRKGRPPVTAARSGRKVVGDLAKFFRPTWTGRQGRRKVTHAKDIGSVVSSMCAASEVLQCDKTLNLQDWKIEDLDDMDENDRWIAEEFAVKREQMANQQPAAPKVTYTRMAKPKVLRTYSRKKKTAESDQQSSSSVQNGQQGNNSEAPKKFTYIPPCHSTLVGFRGLLLHQRHLRQVSEEETASKQCHRFRADTDLALSQGIYHGDILDKGGIRRDINVTDMFPKRFQRENEASSSSASTSQEEEEEKKADELLFQRFKSLFFWPAVMSTIKPSLPHKRQNLFLESDTKLSSKGAAFDDAMAIVAAAQNKPPAKRIKVIKRERMPSGSEVAEEVIVALNQEEEARTMSSPSTSAVSSQEVLSSPPKNAPDPSLVLMPPPPTVPAVRPPKKRHYEFSMTETS